MYKIIVAVLIAVTILSCNPAKQVAKQLKNNQALIDAYNKEHPQRIDTATIFLMGTDSSFFYNAIIDSIRQVKNEVEIQIQNVYKDTCTSASITYNRGYTLGFLAGVNTCLAQVKPTQTIVRTITPAQLITNLQNDNNAKTVAVEKEKLIAAKKDKWLYFFIISSILNVLLATLLIRKIFK